MGAYCSDVAVIGGGIAGLVAALELLEHGYSVVIADRDSVERVGGLARWAFGGMALIGTPEQRLMGVKDSPELALRDWYSFAEFSQNDHWPKAWAECYVNDSLDWVYRWLKQHRLRFLPAVNWVERGLYCPGNSVPRYHVLWGTGALLVERVLARLKTFEGKGLTLLHRHRVEQLDIAGGEVKGCSGLAEETNERFQIRAEHTIVATGGINGSTEQVRANWFKPWGTPPEHILNGANPYSDGRIHDEVKRLDGSLTHLDKMWNYAAGIAHPQPHFNGHGLSLIPCKSALWLNHLGQRIGPDPLVTGFDTRYLCQRVVEQEKPWTWQLLNWRIAAKELAVSGAEHNIYIRDRKLFRFLRDTFLGNHRLVRQLQKESPDFLVASELKELVQKMNARTDQPYIKASVLETTLQDYDRNLARPGRLHNDDQIRRIEHARRWRPDRLRTLKPAPITEAGAGPLIAIHLQFVSRKSLGGIQTDLRCRVLSDSGQFLPGLYAIGEAAGFGGGGANGLRSLEGTFLPGCILTARKAAQAIIKG